MFWRSTLMNDLLIGNKSPNLTSGVDFDFVSRYSLMFSLFLLVYASSSIMHYYCYCYCDCDCDCDCDSLSQQV